MDKAVWKTEIFLLFLIVTKEFKSEGKMEISLELCLGD